MRVAAAVLIVIVTLAAPAFAGPFDGVYRPDQPWAESWDCVSVGSDGGALAIEGDIFKGIERQCKLTNPVPVTGMDAVLYDAECAEEGDSYTHRMMLLRLPEGVAVIEDGYVNPMKFCP